MRQPAGEQIRVRGLVQGVGFRPFVWRQARRFGLDGDVRNDGDGVLIRVAGPIEAIDRLVCALRERPPPLARVDGIARAPLDALVTQPGFSILASDATAPHTGIVPDAATCVDCLADIRDPGNRRHRYAFTNCTHCGPRVSIVERIPYDRGNTAMAAFKMCPACLAEYRDPANRRFHAQPNACPDCGPRIWLETPSARAPVEPQEPVEQILEQVHALLASGRIVAIKGLGGFHLACDARNEAAVRRLRERKHRYAKPFALMARGLDVVGQFARLDAGAREVLVSPAAPVVLLEPGERGCELAASLAPGQNRLGFMLAYTPLHHMLLEPWDTPLVMTSGNLSDEPQFTRNRDARRHLLGGIADAAVLHDRGIVNRVDDSVVDIAAGRVRLVRRARGYAPAPLPMPDGAPFAGAILALGGELKNTFALVKDRQVILSQHIGDLSDVRTSDDYHRLLDLYAEMYAAEPAAIAVDRHPGYQATRTGESLASGSGARVVRVQHHHAHIAAVLAETGRAFSAGPVLGIALDGLGLGDDGTLWGGEFLICDYAGFERVAHLAPVAMPGGVQAVLQPWRNTLAQIFAAIGWREFTARWPALELTGWLATRPVEGMQNMCDHAINSPLTSSCGRLFDAVAAAVGVARERIDYEGQAAIELETLARRAATAAPGYPFAVRAGQPTMLDPAPMWRALFDDLAAGVEARDIAARFHRGLAGAVANLAVCLCHGRDLDTVALSGGVWQNRLLFESVLDDLQSRGLCVLSHAKVPTNDGGLALGQAMVAAACADFDADRTAPH